MSGIISLRGLRCPRGKLSGKLHLHTKVAPTQAMSRAWPALQFCINCYLQASNAEESARARRLQAGDLLHRLGAGTGEARLKAQAARIGKSRGLGLCTALTYYDSIRLYSTPDRKLSSVIAQKQKLWFLTRECHSDIYPSPIAEPQAPASGTEPQSAMRSGLFCCSLSKTCERPTRLPRTPMREAETVGGIGPGMQEEAGIAFASQGTTGCKAGHSQPAMQPLRHVTSAAHRCNHLH